MFQFERECLTSHQQAAGRHGHSSVSSWGRTLGPLDKSPVLHYMFCLILYDTFNNFFSRQTALAIFEDKACSKMQGSVPGEAQTSNPSISSQALYHWAPNFICLPGFVPIHLPTGPSRCWLGGCFLPSLNEITYPRWLLLYPKPKIYLVPPFPKPLDGPQECSVKYM